MSYLPDAKDIFLWADRYWCFREDFDQQRRHTYKYVLVPKSTRQWDDLTGAMAFTRPSPLRDRVSPHRTDGTNGPS